MNQYNENGQKHGYWEERWPDGSLIGNGVYIDGKRDGYWEAYYPNGNIFFKGFFKNDISVGLFRGYWDSGKLWQINNRNIGYEQESFCENITTSIGKTIDGVKDGCWVKIHGRFSRDYKNKTKINITYFV